jgi:hypothetical protein
MAAHSSGSVLAMVWLAENMAVSLKQAIKHQI